MSTAGGVAAEPAKPFSISLGSKSKASVAGAKRPQKRLHSTLEDSDGDHEEPSGKTQVVSSFDQSAGGAIAKVPTDEVKGPLIIPAQKNRDWRSAVKKRGKNLLPQEEQARRNGTTSAGAQEESDEEEQPKYGLNVRNASREVGHDSDTQMQDAPDSSIQKTPQTADEEAMDALLGKRKKSELVIEAKETDNQVDIGSEPDYDAVPLDAFGKGILLGLGWKEGDAVGRKKDKVVKPRLLDRRTAGLGLGAKEVPEGLEEPGAWGKGAKKTNKIDRNYLPLVLKNARTGETLTETELKARQEQQNMVMDDSSDRRHDDSSRRSRRDDRDRDRDRDKERDSERQRRRRSRSRSREYSERREKHGKSRQTDRNCDSDDEHRRRRERRDRDRDYDRHGGESRWDERRHKEKDYDDRKHRRDRYDDGDEEREYRRRHRGFDDQERRCDGYLRKHKD